MEPPKKKAKCEHGRQRHRCKECGGGSICQHRRVRSVCKECRTTAPRTKASICNKPNAVVKEEESDESEEQGSEGDGEMTCTGGCKGEWSRYRFNEQNWNDDPLAEDGMWHAWLSRLYILTVCGCALTISWCCQVLFSVCNVTTGRTILV